MQRIIVSTGGTAGHIFPALATSKIIQERYPAVDILFVGGKYGQEEYLVKQESIPFTALATQGFMGKGLYKKVQSLFLLCTSFFEAIHILRTFKPQAVIGFGGYASFPTLCAAKVLGIPIIIHEQNSIPGTVNKVLSFVSNTICTTFTESEKYFPNKHVVHTGNPIRNNLIMPKEKVDSLSSRNILIMGGSLGAERINDVVYEIAPLLLEQGFSLWHQTGKKHYQEVADKYKKANIDVHVVPFIEDMEAAYTWADFAICRAGATTITELASMGVPAILIPFPYAVHNHQYYNAQAIAKEGGALYLEECSAMKATLLEMIENIADPMVLQPMRRNMLSFVQKGAGERIVDEIEAVIK